MSRLLGPFNHVLRLAAIFAAGILVFLLVRWWLVPPDFGVYGHYRAGALDDVRARPVAYAGQASCVECHGDVAERRQGGRHARLACETCHGPLAKHAAGEGETPSRPDGREACVRCHAKTAGKPTAFPQVIVQEHAGSEACTPCHVPHDPTGS
jgi:hypothetical protein